MGPEQNLGGWGSSRDVPEFQNNREGLRIFKADLGMDKDKID